MQKLKRVKSGRDTNSMNHIFAIRVSLLAKELITLKIILETIEGEMVTAYLLHTKKLIIKLVLHCWL